MKIVQLNLFELPNQKEIDKQISLEKMCKSLFARYNDIERKYIELEREVEQLKRIQEMI